MEKLYKIEKPDLSNYHTHLDDFYLDALYQNEGGNVLLDNFLDTLTEARKKTENPEYLNWKDIKYKSWVPEFKEPKKDNAKTFWSYIKAYRKDKACHTVIRDENGKYFTWTKLSRHEKMAHEIDMDMTKYLLDFPKILETNHQEFQRKSLIEEAIASSQLEGAHTTRKAAKQMIEEKREPRNADERMILNNFITMEAIQKKYKNKKLTIKSLLELHKMLTIGAKNLDESEQGNFRSSSDKIVIAKGDDPTVISYITPSIDFVKTEIQRLIDFANDELGEDFIHPVTKAIMLHFWIGLLHPFVDGNGRLARGLFYWYLLRQGGNYWAFALLSISIAIKAAPAQYSEAYIFSEQDDNDLTYFVDYNFRKIAQAAENFKKYVSNKLREAREAEEIMSKHHNLTQRQIKILSLLRENPHKLLNVSLCVKIYEVTKATAIKDLKQLLHLGFVKTERRGKNVYYRPTNKIAAVFNGD